jgi:hypothetical protein
VAAALRRFPDCQLAAVPQGLPLPASSPSLTTWRVALPVKWEEDAPVSRNERPLEWFAELVRGGPRLLVTRFATSPPTDNCPQPKEAQPLSQLDIRLI